MLQEDITKKEDRLDQIKKRLILLENKKNDGSFTMEEIFELYLLRKELENLEKLNDK